MIDRVIGKRYVIKEAVGTGGMAVVYRAWDTVNKRTVAIKVLRPELETDTEFVRRFSREAEAASKVSHENIVNMLDVGKDEELRYIVMEYVDGQTLKELIRSEGRIRPDMAVRMAIRILAAVDHAHRNGIVHRDIKPQNIMLISDGTIKVTDFGIAHFSRGETKTMGENAIGSVHYISPEQAKGSVTDAKADIYSVGVVLYEMLTGSLPFQSDSAVSVALMQLQNEAVRPKSINPDIAVGLEQIIIRAMQKNPADRYQSAAEMLLDIEAFKKNPDIKFDYSYFVDKQPTKFVPAAVAKSVSEEEPPYIEPVEDDSADDLVQLDPRSKKKTIAVLCGTLAALLVFAIAIIILAIPDSDGDEISVPNFLGMKYDDIIGNDEYKNQFEFSFETVLDTSKEDGEIINQEPAANRKIKRGEEIKLTVASDGTQETVPDVYGYQLAEAQDILYAKNFRVEIEKEYDLENEVNTVIKTAPEKNASVEYGATITLYIATDENTVTVDVPPLVGSTLSEAKAKLEAVGLKLDTVNTEYRNSAERAGTVIGNERVGEAVPIGTSIAVYVSNGYLSSVSISFTLPRADEGGELVVYVNGETAETRSVTLNGGTFTTSVRGNGTEDEIVVTIDGQTVYKATASFVEGKLNDDVSSGAYTTTTTETTTRITTRPRPTPTTTAEPTTSAKPTTTTTIAPPTVIPPTEADTTQPTPPKPVDSTIDEPLTLPPAEDNP